MTSTVLTHIKAPNFKSIISYLIFVPQSDRADTHILILLYRLGQNETIDEEVKYVYLQSKIIRNNINSHKILIL
jgi:hypothetical protein